jgi:hypothetical protein
MQDWRTILEDGRIRTQKYNQKKIVLDKNIDNAMKK